MAVLNIVAFLQLFTIAICHILRLKCKGEADFVIRESGRRLLGTPIFTHEGMNLQDCYKQCYHQPECKSVNINAADGSGVCELMSKSSFNVKDKVTLTDSVGWEYHTTNFSSRLIGTNCKSHGANICKKHQTCMDSCECPGYECLDCSEAAKIGYHCNVCAGNPCGIHGECTENGNSFKCNCHQRYTGKTCKEVVVVNPCNSDPCVAGSICNSSGDGYSCLPI